MRNSILGFLFLGLFIFSVNGWAQQGKDGAFTTATSATVNVYTTLTANAMAGSTNISVASSAGISVGDLLLLIEIKGVSINAYHDTTRPFPALDTNNSYLINNALPYGKILNVSSCGNNEFAEVNAVSGTTITLDCGLSNEFDVNGHVQVIRVPRYTTLTLNSGANITCPQWNGSTGGVVAIEVQGNTTINTGGKIDASGLGFRGGALHMKPFQGGVTNYGTTHWDYAAWKGEGVFGDTAYYRSKVSGDFGWGAMANGGGGGSDNNGGGGGGGNAGNVTTYPWTGKGVPDASIAGYVTAWNLESASFATSHSSGGGRGGYTYSSSNQNPQSVAPGNSAWSGDSRRVYGGMGGEALDYSTGKVFMGGGGGAGDENDGYGGAGANGGGIVFLLSYGSVSGGGQILADGSNGSDTQAPSPSFNSCTGRDGAGGGGAGGAILIRSVGAITLSNALPLSAAGGKGGNVTIKCNASTNHDGYGPGGGGGGGYVGTTSAVTNSVLGGNNGTLAGSGNFYSSNIATNFPPNGATKGDAGINATITNFYITANNYTVCAGTSASLSVTANGTGIPNPISYEWYNAQTGGSPVFTGNPYNTGALSVGTYTYYAGTCPGIYRIPVVVTVLNAPTVSVTATPTAVCAGQSATLTASGASTYTWSANAGGGTSNPTVVTPTVNTTYTVTGANGTCTNSQTVAVAITTAPTLTATATPTAVCAGQSATLNATGAASYTWSANAGGVLTASAVVTPTVNTTYTVTGGNGGCTSTQTVAVAMTSAPTLTATATPTSVCAGQTATLTASGATSYTWSANAGSALTATTVVTPTVNTTYTVTGGNGGCISTQTVAISMNAAPTLTITATPTAVCPGTSSTLTAVGATSYTWSANAGGVFTPTAIVTPTVSTTYTVTGNNGGCTSTQTVSVAMASPPTLTITATPAAICNGGNSLLTASGASSYTWSANAGGVNTSTVSVTPTVTTTYTLTGDSGGCVATTMLSVIVNQGPTAADSSSVAAACGQSNGSYALNSVTGGTAGYQINFNGSGFTPISSFPYTVPNLSANIYSIVIQDSKGCTYTTSINIGNVGGITSVDTTVGNAVCNPSNSGYIVLNSVTGGTGPYQVDINSGGFNAIASFPDSLKNLTAGNYTVTVKDNSGCQHSTIITVGSTGGITQVNTSTQNAVCNPAASGAIVISSVSGGTSPFQYSLNGGTLTNIAAFPDSIKSLSAGTYTLSIQDAAGCSSTSTISITSPNGPTSASGNTVNDTCGKSVGSLNVLVVSGGTPSYQYSMNGGAYQSSTSFSGLAAGIYTVSVKDNNGCTFTYLDTVNATTMPSPTVTPLSASFCQGGSTTLTSSSATGNTWNTTATTQTISVSTADSFWVSVNINGCIVKSNTVVITVNPNPTVTVNSDSICNGTSTTLFATVMPVGGALNYTWSPAGGLSSTTGASAVANPSVTTVYTVSVQDANSCLGVTTTTVKVNPTPPAPTVNPDTLLYCLYQNAPPLHVPSSGGSIVTWQTNGQTIADSTIIPATNILGTTTYSVFQSVAGCSSSGTQVTVMVIPGPSAAFVTNPSSGSVFTAQTVTFTPNQLSPYNQYFWNFNEPASGSNTSNAPVPTHDYMSEGTYCPHLLVISLQTGCADSNTICVDVFNGVNVIIPNVFTPNQDNINDVFSIKTDGINELACDIYDRWGLKLYGWNDPKGFWDGTTNGKACSDGTYFYVVSTKDVKGVSKTYKGYVQLIK